MRDDQEIRLGCLQIAMAKAGTSIDEAKKMAEQMVPFVTGEPSAPDAAAPASPAVRAIAPRQR